MGSSCSSGQRNKDEDSVSNKSEESPSYKLRTQDKTEQSDEIEEKREAFSQPAPLPQPTITPKPQLQSVSESLSPGSPAPDKVATPTVKTELLSSLLSNASLKANKIVLFICAADSQDCKVEKGLIHREVYPGLRESMREKGFTLHIVDLCWSLHEKTPEPAELVLNELNRQSETGYIVPVVLLNQCLGASLVPKTIEPADLETAKQSDKDHILSDYYALDNMAQPPCYRLIPPATLIPKFKSENKEEREKALEEWRGEVDKLIGVFLSAFSNELRDTYLTTLVEQEVHNTVLMSEVLAKRCIWLQRVSSGQSQQQPSSTPANMETARRLDALQARLKRELSEGHIQRAVGPGADQDQTQYQEQVVSFTKKTLTSILDSIVSQHQAMVLEKDGVVVSSNLVEEVWIQSYWAKKSSQCSANRQQLLQSLSKSSSGIVVLVGEQGWGKTTLVSRLSESNPRIILCSANLSQSSATLESALHSIILQLDLDYRPLNFSLECFGKDLPGAFEKATKDEPITVILDGLDQFRDFGTVNDVSWLPKTLPENATLIVTVVENGPIYELLKTHLGTSENFIQVPSLEMKEAEGMLMSSIVEYNHSLQSDVQQAVLASLKHSTNPLYIKVLAWQTSWCNEYDHKLKPEGDLNKQIDTMFSDLELILGKDKVGICLSLLTATKWGLLDSEMVDLLASNEIYHTSTTYLPWAGALLFWSRIHKEMTPFLRTCPSTSLITWRDNAFRNVAITKYKTRMSSAHATIATYFKGELWKGHELKSRALSQPTNIGSSFNKRKLEELPYAVFKNTGNCKEFLTDHNWILQKLCATSLSQVLEDWKVCEGPDWLGEVLRSPGLGYDGRQLYTHLNTIKSNLPKEWQDAATNPPIPSLVLLNQIQTNESKEDKYFDILLRLPQNPNYVVTVNTEKEEISVWSVQKCEKVRSLKGIPQPLSLEMINDYHCVVLCKRELRVYDLDNGVLLSKLKGVMNQKMPYYGLHGADHLVALSRNRMYVNLMNISTGDLVTTFKAGEDRFLNSLLVSGDGRMLVCGDETQKPFPLLVWDLASRKLLYDLRIPGHDFITSLSAITHQGHYVSCIAKEVDEPSPNFIVVYDLQSGTLFKKWKPGVDCVAVDISSRHTCVVSGHVDGTILVWDLITGNCRWTLKGHTAPVRYLRLDASSCLSMDAKSTDIRLWDLATGEQRAVYSPPGKVTSCEVTHDGRLVTVAVESISKPICLELRHNPTLQLLDTNIKPYGKEENAGKEFTVSEEVR